MVQVARIGLCPVPTLADWDTATGGRIGTTTFRAADATVRARARFKTNMFMAYLSRVRPSVRPGPRDTPCQASMREAAGANGADNRL